MNVIYILFNYLNIMSDIKLKFPKKRFLFQYFYILCEIIFIHYIQTISKFICPSGVRVRPLLTDRPRCNHRRPHCARNHPFYQHKCRSHPVPQPKHPSIYVGSGLLIRFRIYYISKYNKI